MNLVASAATAASRSEFGGMTGSVAFDVAIVVYAPVLMVTLAVGLGLYLDSLSSAETKREGARTILWAPAWPVWVAVQVVRFFARLVKDAR
jgi:hypothetical protein